MITKKRKENQRFRRKELKKCVWEKKNENIKEEIHYELFLLGGFIIFSIVTGIIGFFVGLTCYNNGGMGFLIGFLAPLIVLFSLWGVLDNLH